MILLLIAWVIEHWRALVLWSALAVVLYDVAGLRAPPVPDAPTAKPRRRKRHCADCQCSDK